MSKFLSQSNVRVTKKKCTERPWGRDAHTSAAHYFHRGDVTANSQGPRMVNVTQKIPCEESKSQVVNPRIVRVYCTDHAVHDNMYSKIRWHALIILYMSSCTVWSVYCTHEDQSGPISQACPACQCHLHKNGSLGTHTVLWYSWLCLCALIVLKKSIIHSHVQPCGCWLHHLLGTRLYH